MVLQNKQVEAKGFFSAVYAVVLIAKISFFPGLNDTNIFFVLHSIV